ncbi:hypothetical protein AB1285_24605 [Microbacterium sp. NRRL B-14842]|uniref:hypothetical protein n=1 Tax=Microbacterium sp. NRRL B-14842 TaxID=3162881 RepID=UPI003D2E7EC2
MGAVDQGAHAALGREVGDAAGRQQASRGRGDLVDDEQPRARGEGVGEQLTISSSSASRGRATVRTAAPNRRARRSAPMVMAP